MLPRTEAAPASLLGVLIYPEPHLSPVPLAPALGLLLASGVLIALTGRLRLMILLPVVAAYIPSLQIGFAAILVTLALFIAAYGGQRLVRQLDHIDRLFLAVLVWATGPWLVNLGIETDLWCTEGAIGLFAGMTTPVTFHRARRCGWSR